jgi:hypothetical protein
MDIPQDYLYLILQFNAAGVPITCVFYQKLRGKPGKCAVRKILGRKGFERLKVLKS